MDQNTSDKYLLITIVYKIDGHILFVILILKTKYGTNRSVFHSVYMYGVFNQF